MKKTAKREYDFHSAKRGVVGVSVPKGKTRITIRLNNGVLAWFREKVEKAGGGDYRTVINEALRQHMRRADEPLKKDCAAWFAKRPPCFLATTVVALFLRPGLETPSQLA